MARLIDADELKLELKWLEIDKPVYHDVMSTIDETPTADAIPRDFHDKCMEIEIQKRMGMVEVVRCKDCKWYEESKTPEIYPIRFCYRLGNDKGFRVGYKCDGNDFCSRGERREDD